MARPRTRAVSRNLQDVALTPAPGIDRYPTVRGAGITLEYISSALRSATSGLRESWVDLLSELIERDPHAFSVVMKRILAVAGGRVEITAAITEASDPDYKKAQDIAGFVAAQVDQLDDLASSVAHLLWGIYYQIAGCEILWEQDGHDWNVKALDRIGSRRLWYPDPASWDVFVYQARDVGTGGYRGLRVGDFPGKFVLHAPVLRGDAPTREGLGRELAFWMSMKGVAARAAVAYVEGYSRQKYVATYQRGAAASSKGTNADARDIARASATVTALAEGVFAGGVLPDSIKLELLRTQGGISHADWIKLCDDQITKAVLGQTGTTDMGKNGSRAQAQTMRDDQVQLTRYDAQSLAATLRRDLVRPLTLLNFAGAERLVPRVTVHANENPDPAKILAMAKDAVSIGMPLDADRLGAMTGLPLVAPGDTNARVLQPAGVGAGVPASKAEEENPADPDQPAGGTNDDGAPDDEGEAGMTDRVPARLN
jgi:phage gp29-like protein